MGDVSMEDFGCVAISPLWLGGKESNREVTVLHNVPKIVGATEAPAHRRSPAACFLAENRL